MRHVLLPLFAGVGVAVATAAESAPTVYVPLGSANKIAVVDAATDTVTDHIRGLVNPHGLAITPDGRYLIAGSNQQATADAGKPPPKPEGMSEEEHRSHHSAPVGGSTHAAAVSHVAIVSVKDRSVVRRVDVRGAVHHTAVTPDGRYAISTHTTVGGISVIDLSTFQVVKTIPTGLVPNYAAFTRDGTRVYVSNAGNNTISEIDTENWIVARNILVGKGPEHLVLSPDDTRLFVNNVASGDVSVVDLEMGKVVNTYPIGAQPHGIDLSGDGRTLFAASKQDDKLVAIDLEDGKPKSVSLSPAPYHVTVVKGTDKLYVSSRAKPKIRVLAQSSLKQLGEIPIDGEGHQMVVMNH